MVLKWFCWCYSLCVLASSTAFRVTVPARVLLGIRGQPIVLGCTFTPDPSSDLSTLVVTWQRLDDSHVVHSFYYQKDQLELQWPSYRNRTSLFISELLNGNASLRIDPVGPRDAGWYLCTVSNTKGTDKAQVKMEYGALYTEPRLSVNVSCSNLTVWFETEGYPEPEVTWLGEKGKIPSHTEITKSDEAVGLFYLKSSYVGLRPVVNVTFMVKSKFLNQELQRPVNIRCGEEKDICGANTTVIVLSILCLMLFLSMMFLLIRLRRKSRVLA